MIQGFNYLDFLRALSFGGLVGAGIAGIIYLQFPYFHTITSLEYFVIYGGLFGAGAQRGIEGIINVALFPLGGFIKYYEKLIELDFLRRWGKISNEEYKTINAKLTEARFLGTPLPDRPSTPSTQQLPPKT